MYESLEVSVSEIRVLHLRPGHASTDVQAWLERVTVPPLPLVFSTSSHFNELRNIVDDAYDAVQDGDSIEHAELLRWKRIYNELIWLYKARSRRHADKIDSDYQPDVKQQDRLARRLSKATSYLLCFVQKRADHLSEGDRIEATQAMITWLQEHDSRMATDLCGPDVHTETSYEAVSYTWGDATHRAPMYLDGVPIDAPGSAVNALRGLRLHNSTRVIWIDALCIDQGNAEERASQVLLMAKIYSSATRTLIWLGEAYGNDAKALQCLHTLAQCSNDPVADIELAPPLETAEAASTSLQDVLDSIASSEPVDVLLKAISSFFAKPWFRRLWVYQEMMLSRTCMCYIREHQLSWRAVELGVYYLFAMITHNSLGIFTSWAMGEGAYLPAMTIMAKKIRRERHPSEEAWSISPLLYETHNLQCSVARDKIYAVLGVTYWAKYRMEIPHWFRPNYSISEEECMRRATIGVIESEGVLDCLATPLHSKEKPTWVIEWYEAKSLWGQA
ncbi:hypothetical protein LTR86_007112 [Recurvomyces mirabilis]|nr:hypothetical protein LTR86_007112 [Recurvomyces mirabilis]